jgi:hypothetical protein
MQIEGAQDQESPPQKSAGSLYFRVSEKLTNWIYFTVVIVGPIVYGVHLIENYQKVHAEIREEAATVIKPAVDEGSVSEVGYIFSMRRETYIRDPNFNLVWFIAVPATGERYSCKYLGGFQDFKTGDGVALIHPKDDEGSVDHASYIVGLHDREQGKASLIGVNNLEILELDAE